jgi:hypothetical protein
LEVLLKGSNTLFLNHPSSVPEFNKRILVNLVKFRDLFEPLPQFPDLLLENKTYGSSFLSQVSKLYQWDSTTPFLNSGHKEIYLLSASTLLNRTIHLLHIKENSLSLHQKYGEHPESIMILEHDGYYYFLYTSTPNPLGITQVYFNQFLLQSTLIKDNFYTLLKNGTREELAQKIHVIGYHSKAVDVTLIQKTSIVFLELYAVLECLTHFESFLNSEFVCILTDSKVTMQLLNGTKVVNRNSKLQSLSQKILFWFRSKCISVVSIKGKHNLSDIFSRLLPAHAQHVLFEPVKPDYSCDKFDVYPIQSAAVTSSTPHPINKINEYVKAVTPFPSLPAFVNKYVHMYRSLMDTTTFVQFQLMTQDCPNMDPSTVKRVNNKILLPCKLTHVLVALYHASLNHPGKVALYKYINVFYHVLNKTYLKNLIDKLCDSCLVCITCKPKTHNYALGSSNRNLMFQPNQMIYADLYEMSTLANMTGGDREHVKSLLIIHDIYSKATFIFPIPEKRQYCIIQALAGYFQANKLCKYFVSDNGSVFRGEKIRRFLKDLNIHMMDTSAYSPRSHGVIERQVQRVVTLLRKANFDNPEVSFCRTISEVGYAINTTPYSNSFLCPLNVHYLSYLNFENTIENEGSPLLKAPYCDYNMSFKPQHQEKAKELSQEVQKFRDEYMTLKKKQLQELNANKKEHEFKLHDFVFLKDHTHIKTQAIFKPNIWQVLKLMDRVLTVQNVVTLQTTAFNTMDIKKLKLDSITDVQLPLFLIDELKLITLTNLKEILFASDNTPPVFTQRKSTRIQDRKNKNDPLYVQPPPQAVPDNPYFDTDLSKYLPRLIDEIDALQTIHE